MGKYLNYTAFITIVVTAIILLLPLQWALAADILMGKGESRVLPVQNLERVAVADPDIADVLVVSSTEVLVNAKSLGKTTLHIWEKTGRTSYSLRVVTDKNDLAAQLEELIGIDTVTVRIIEDSVILDGVVTSKEQQQRAVKAAGAYGDKVIDLTVVRGTPTTPLVQRVKSAIGVPSVEVVQIEDTLVLQGTVEHPREKHRAETIAAIFSPKVVSLLELSEHPAAGKVDAQPAAEKKVDDQGKNVISPSQSQSETQRDKQEAAARLRQLLDEPEVTVTQVGRSLVLEGTVPNEYRHRRAVALAKALEFNVVDLLIVKEPKLVTEKPEGEEEKKASDSVPSGPRQKSEGTSQAVSSDQKQIPLEELRQLIGLDTVKLRLIADVLFIEGTVPSELAKRKVEAAASAAGYRYESFLEVIDDSVSVLSPKPEEKLEPEVKNDISSVVHQLKEVVSDPRIRVYAVNQSLFLEGVVDSEYARERAEKIASALLPSGEIVSLIQVQKTAADGESEKPPAAQLEKEIAVQPRQDDRNQENQKSHGPQKNQKLNEPREEEKLEALTRRIASVMPYPGVKVAIIADTVVLQGEVTREEQISKAEQLAGIFGLPVVNLLSVKPTVSPKSDTPQRVKALLQMDGVEVTEVGDKLLLEGEVQTSLEYSRAMEIAGMFSPNVVNLIKVKEPHQVMIQVQAIEANKVAMSKLGITWGSLDPLFEPHIAYVGQNELLGPLELLSRLAGQIEILADTGDAKLLANPTLLTKSGHQASFLVGGEIPVVIPKGNEMAVEWKEYGVKLKVTPEVVSTGDVRVTVQPEVSTLDWANAVRLNSITIPAMKTRRTETTVDLKDGGTLALGGLIQNDESKQVQKVPLLGDLPILGALFRSEKFKREETELIFLITVKVISGPADQLAAAGLSLLGKLKSLGSAAQTGGQQANESKDAQNEQAKAQMESKPPEESGPDSQALPGRGLEYE